MFSLAIVRKVLEFLDSVIPLEEQRYVERARRIRGAYEPAEFHTIASSAFAIASKCIDLVAGSGLVTQETVSAVEQCRSARRQRFKYASALRPQPESCQQIHEKFMRLHSVRGFAFEKLVSQLESTKAYENRELSLFWALVSAQRTFLEETAASEKEHWSHEERLTGVLEAHLRGELRRFAPEWRALRANKRSQLDFTSVDLSRGRMERVTGADFGVIFRVCEPDSPEYFRAIRFQAKKAFAIRAIEF
jgi:hypothetical protein